MRSARHDSGFSLLEVVIATALLVLVATTAVASLRSGVATLGATESTAAAIDAIREYSELTYGLTATQLDALDDTVTAPLLANGEPFPNAGDLTLEVDVQAVSDLDPLTVVDIGSSLSRLVTVTAVSQGQQVMEAAWLVIEL